MSGKPGPASPAPSSAANGSGAGGGGGLTPGGTWARPDGAQDRHHRERGRSQDAHPEELRQDTPDARQSRWTGVGDGGDPVGQAGRHHRRLARLQEASELELQAVIGHRVTSRVSLGSIVERIRRSAWWSRDFTVPLGIPMRAAMSSTVRSR